MKWPSRALKNKTNPPKSVVFETFLWFPRKCEDEFSRWLERVYCHKTYDWIVHSQSWIKELKYYPINEETIRMFLYSNMSWADATARVKAAALVYNKRPYVKTSANFDVLKPIKDE